MTTRISVLAFLLLSGTLTAADWPQWRGPNRDGIAVGSPALLDTFPPDGPRKVWTSEDIPGDQPAGGWGSPAVADGKVFVYAYRSTTPPWRILTQDQLSAWGYDDRMPADLRKLVEDTRADDLRKQATNATVWVAEWMKTNLKPDQDEWKHAIRTRLLEGPAAIPWDTCTKLLPILNRKFENTNALVDWIATNGIEAADSKMIVRKMSQVQSNDLSGDFVICLDASTGKTLWKTAVPGTWLAWAASPTPSIVGSRCYICNSESRIYCLDVADGRVIWRSDRMGAETHHHNRSSSVLIVGHAAVAFSDKGLFAVETQTGKTLWTYALSSGQQASAAQWLVDGKFWIIADAGAAGFICLNPADGAVIWKVSGSGITGTSTPVVFGQYAAVTGNKHLTLFKIATNGATIVWNNDQIKDAYANVVIRGDYVYFAGTSAKGGKAMCLAVKDGTTVWEAPLAGANDTSPALADGKVFVVNGKQLCIFKADPAQFSLLARVDLGLSKWSSPAIAADRLFLRTTNSVICIDLAKPK